MDGRFLLGPSGGARKAGSAMAGRARQLDAMEDAATSTGGGAGMVPPAAAAKPAVTPVGGPSMRKPTLDPLRGLSDSAKARFGKGMVKP